MDFDVRVWRPSYDRDCEIETAGRVIDFDRGLRLCRRDDDRHRESESDDARASVSGLEIGTDEDETRNDAFFFPYSCSLTFDVFFLYFCCDSGFWLDWPTWISLPCP